MQQHVQKMSKYSIRFCLKMTHQILNEPRRTQVRVGQRNATIKMAL